MVVYADILLCINLIVNYFLLLATARFSGRKPNRKRLLLGALLGAGYALILFVPGLPPWALLLTKLTASGIILRASFCWVSLLQYGKEYIVFFTVNFLFAGLMFALWLFAAPNGMVFYNGVVYFQINAVMLVAFTALAYGISELFIRFFHKKEVYSTMYDVILKLGKKQIFLRGLLDTGNTLKDTYTGYPVAICTLDSIRAILPPSLIDLFSSPLNIERLDHLMTKNTTNRFKFIPYHTVGFSGILPAFQPDYMELIGEKNHFYIEAVYLAVTPEPLSQGNYDILLNAQMLVMERQFKEKRLAGIR